MILDYLWGLYLLTEWYLVSGINEPPQVIVDQLLKIYATAVLKIERIQGKTNWTVNPYRPRKKYQPNYVVFSFIKYRTCDPNSSGVK